MVDYSKSKIYKIIDYTSDKIYIGSTCQNTISKRLAEHVHCYKKYLKGKYGYTTSFEIIKNSNFDIVLIESVNCSCKDELHAREAVHIKNEPTCINKSIPNNLKFLGKKQYQNEADKKRKTQRKTQLFYCDMCKCTVKQKGKITHMNTLKHSHNSLLGTVEK